MKKQLVVCGGGNSAHALIPFLKGSIFDVSILTSRPECWQETVCLEWHDTDGKVLDRYSNKLVKASNRPEELIPQADYIILCMPVHQYRLCLKRIAPFINHGKTVYIGAMYGQAGFNWMVNELRRQYPLTNIAFFAYGLLPWICRTVEYGHSAIVYGGKAMNYAACDPQGCFGRLKEELFDNITVKWFGEGDTVQSANFLSLTLSVDNQIIHPSRCYGLCKANGVEWKDKSDVPMFYRDYDDLSAQLLVDLDNDYNMVRNAVRLLYPEKDYSLMMDYLSLERFSYQSQNTDVKATFLSSKTLASIATPVVEGKNGHWTFDYNHRFFLDDIYYGICVAKWMAEKLDVSTPTIDTILRWAQTMRGERIVDWEGRLLLDSPDLNAPFKSGIPFYYGMDTIDDCVD